MQFSRRSIHSQRASSSTNGLLRLKIALEVEGIQTLGLRELRLPDAALDIAPVAVDALQFAQAQQITRIVGLILGAGQCTLLVFAGEGGQLQQLQMMREEDLRRSGGVGVHGATPILPWRIRHCNKAR